MVVAETAAAKRSPRLGSVRRAASVNAVFTGRTSPHRRHIPIPETQTQRIVGRTTALSDEVLHSVESGQRAAIDAVQKFVDTADEKLPSLGDEHPSTRQEVIDAALNLADRLVHTEYDFLRKVVDSAGKALSGPGDGQ
jgi:hypothetical protein